MRGCQKQTREEDLGGSPGHGWTGRPKADNILLVRWGVTEYVLDTNGGELESFNKAMLHKKKNEWLKAM
jgi:hypothetical protein